MAEHIFHLDILATSARVSWEIQKQLCADSPNQSQKISGTSEFLKITNTILNRDKPYHLFSADTYLLTAHSLLADPRPLTGRKNIGISLCQLEK